MSGVLSPLLSSRCFQAHSEVSNIHPALTGIKPPSRGVCCFVYAVARPGVAFWIQAAHVCVLAKASVTQPVEGLTGSSLFPWFPPPSALRGVTSVTPLRVLSFMLELA